MKIVINKCYGGFGLSKAAQEEYAKRKAIDAGRYLELPDSYEHIVQWEIPRDDADLVSIVETMGVDANTWASELAVVEIPDGVDWYIEEYDGLEWIAERHRTWR